MYSKLDADLAPYLPVPVTAVHPADVLPWAHVSANKDKAHSHILRDDWSYDLKTQMANHMELYHSKSSTAHQPQHSETGKAEFYGYFAVHFTVFWLRAIRNLVRKAIP